MNKETSFFITTLILTIIDQAVKIIITTTTPTINLLILRVHHVTNTGASFGILTGNNNLLIWLSIIALGAFMLWYEKLPRATTPWIIITGGGILSNLIDRVLRGHVVDYLDLGWWPVFNIADSMIVIGIGMIIITLIREEKGKKA